MEILRRQRPDDPEPWKTLYRGPPNDGVFRLRQNKFPTVSQISFSGNVAAYTLHEDDGIEPGCHNGWTQSVIKFNGIVESSYETLCNNDKKSGFLMAHRMHKDYQQTDEWVDHQFFRLRAFVTANRFHIYRGLSGERDSQNQDDIMSDIVSTSNAALNNLLTSATTPYLHSFPDIAFRRLSQRYPPIPDSVQCGLIVISPYRKSPRAPSLPGWTKICLLDSQSYRGL